MPRHGRAYPKPGTSDSSLLSFCSSVSAGISSVEHEPDAHAPNGKTSPIHCVCSSELPRARRG
jgi:hypothetical protein